MPTIQYLQAMPYNKRKRPKKDGCPGPVRGVRYKNSKISPANIAADDETKVRSKLEKECVEYFKEHKIEFSYEPLILLTGKQYRPDFYLPGLDLFIEICGYTHMPFYNDRMEKKKRLYKKHGLKVVFIVGEKRKLIKENLANCLKQNPDEGIQK